MVTDDAIKKAEERVKGLKARKAEQEAEAALAKRTEELRTSIQKAVSTAVKSSSVQIPEKGLLIAISKGEGNVVAVEVSLGKPGARRCGNGNRTTLAALGYSGFVLPDGSEVDSPASVLEAMKAPYYGHGGGDSPQREIIKWAKANPDKAKEVLVKIGDEAISLKEAVAKL